MTKFIGKPYAGKPHVRFEEGTPKQIYFIFALGSTLPGEKMVDGLIVGLLDCWIVGLLDCYLSANELTDENKKMNIEQVSTILRHSSI